MQILTKTGTRNINFIPRQTISGSKVYSLVIKSEAENKVILTDSTATFTELDYYYQYSTTQALVENNYYTITITNTTDGIVIFKDKMYCTDQTLSDYEISNGVYIEQSTGNNEFVYYG
tara:strand:+ start:331 stop:684 length:354 start_codon:yes stop_codon:yes gene_type:complete